jgi:PKD repeat protein
MAFVLRVVRPLLVAGLVALGLVAIPGTASAATGDIGFEGPSFTGAPNAPTADKPESKLWFTPDGTWWANLFETSSKTWHIFRLDRGTHAWVDTGVQTDDRANTSSDTLFDSATNKLYVATHVVSASSSTSPVTSKSNNPSRLYRYSYSNGTFTRDANFPATISNNSTESLTIDRDSTGTLWATWTQVSGSSTAGFTNTLFVNSTSGGDTGWGAPFTPTVSNVPATAVKPSPDDIATLVSYAGKIGLLWSNQKDSAIYWAVHTDSAARTSWAGGTASSGTSRADDHVNIKSLQSSDSTGQVFAVVKTSLDSTSTNTADAQITLLSLSGGTWKETTFGTIADCHTRPQLVLDNTNKTVHVVATAPTASGCPNSGAPGTIYEKVAPMGTGVFPAGRGTAIIRDADNANMNNPTLTKQTVTGGTGLVVLASNTATARYWHADISLNPATPVPTAGFNASPASGTAPLAVQFTDTSTGSPTSWAWDFGDGSTATTQNPSHTYTTAGTFTVTLRATNAGGTSAPATKTVTVTQATSRQVTAGASTKTQSATAVTGVAITKPTGVANGDVLIAQITADNNPGISAAPAGWSTVVAPLSIGTGARLFVYYHVVTNAATEPASYNWTLSAAQKWNAGISDFHGVNTTTPFDTGAKTRVQNTATSTSVTVPSATTVTAGAMVVGGVGLNSGTAGVTQPSGWTEGFESTTVQVSESAWQARPTVGATGNAVWRFSKGAASAGWLRPLRPA